MGGHRADDPAWQARRAQTLDQRALDFLHLVDRL
jgi:hypothetical protein